MINVNKITSTLAKLPDQQLQQYAQMHKSDPYIMALAMSESNRRKEMRSAGQGAQGMQEQPKVVDQMVAEMAPRPAQAMPEDMGIGQLNAGDMNFAGGGIIAFADGGDVERYQYGGHIPRYQGNATDGSLVRGDFFGQLDQQKAEQINQLNGQLAVIEPQLRAAAASGDQQAIQLYAQQAQAVRNQISAVREATGNRVGTIDKLTAVASPPAQDMAQFDAASNLYMTERANKQAAVVAPKVDAAPKADTTRRAGPGAAPAASVAGPKAPAQAGLGDLATLRQDILDKQKFTDPAAAGLKELETRELAAAEEVKASLLRDQAKFDDAYKGREKRLSDRELDIGKQKDTNMGLAFLNAGLAIMSTPGGLATAIGKGAQTGTAQFAAGLDKIRSAQERLDDARDKMEDLKLNRAEMSAKEVRAAEKDIRNVGIDAEKRGIDGIRMAADVNRKTAAEMFKATVDVGVNREKIDAERENTLTREAGANTRNKVSTDAALQSPERMAYMSAFEKTKTKANPQGDPAAAYQSIVAMKADPRSQEKLRGDWLDMAKRLQIQADYPNIKTFEDYMSVFGGGGGGGGGGDGLRVVGVR